MAHFSSILFFSCRLFWNMKIEFIRTSHRKKKNRRQSSYTHFLVDKCVNTDFKPLRFILGCPKCNIQIGNKNKNRRYYRRFLCWTSIDVIFLSLCNKSASIGPIKWRHAHHKPKAKDNNQKTNKKEEKNPSRFRKVSSSFLDGSFIPTEKYSMLLLLLPLFKTKFIVVKLRATFFQYKSRRQDQLECCM